MWLEYKALGDQLNPTGVAELAEIRNGVAARMHANEASTKKAALPPKARVAIDRLVSEWIVDDDQCANAAEKPGFKRLFGGATDGAYEGCGCKTVSGHVAKLAVEGKAKTTKLHEIVLVQNKLRLVISADLWSKNGVALLGILSHAILEVKDPKGQLMWQMVEVLAGAIPCKKDRHTGEYVEIATFKELAKYGVSAPTEEIFKSKTDRGSNMLKGYENLDNDPCTDHLIDTSVGSFLEHEAVAPILKKGRAIVGSFNMSTIGKSDLAECQVAVGVATKNLVQDVVTRWSSTFSMCNSLRENQDALMLYAIKKENVASDTFKANSFSIEEWHIANQSCAVLGGLATASNVLEGKNYPTSNMVIPYIYGCIFSLQPESATIQLWDGRPIKATDLHPSVKAAREALHQSLRGFWIVDIKPSRLMFLLICTLLDPRLIELRLPLLTAEVKAQAKAAFLAEYALNWAPVKAKEDEGDKGEGEKGEGEKSEGEKGDGTCGTFTQVGMGSFSDFMQAMDAHGILPAQEPTEQASEVGEAELYLQMSAAPQSTDVLQWWACHKSRFPHLARMAQQFLAVPATSASAERVFSLAGRIFSDLTQNQSDTTLEDRMWAKINRKQVLE